MILGTIMIHDFPIMKYYMNNYFRKFKRTILKFQWNRRRDLPLALDKRLINAWLRGRLAPKF